MSQIQIPYHIGLVLVTQSCPALCNPVDCSPPDSSIPGIFQANGVGCHFLLQCITGTGYMYHWHSICINTMYHWHCMYQLYVHGTIGIIGTICPICINTMYHWHSICMNNTYSNTEFPGGPMAKNPPVNVGNTDSIPALGRFHSLGATMPVCHNFRGCALESEFHRERSPWTITKCSPHLLQLEKA